MVSEKKVAGFRDTSVSMALWGAAWRDVLGFNVMLEQIMMNPILEVIVNGECRSV